MDRRGTAVIVIAERGGTTVIVIAERAEDVTVIADNTNALGGPFTNINNTNALGGLAVVLHGCGWHLHVCRKN